jgi:HlyD family secretion protein
MRLIRHALWAAGAIGLVIILVFALRPRAVDVETAVVKRGQFEETIVEDGKTRVRERYTISAPVAGSLLRIGLKAGDAVSVGAQVASILPNPSPLLDIRMRQAAEARVGAAEAAEARAAALVAQAEGAAAQARVEAARSRDLVTRGAAPHSRLEHDELALNTALRELEALNSAHHATTHEVEAARAALLADGSSREGAQPWQVRSPVAGRVLHILQESEASVALGAALVEIGDPADIEVIADVLTTDAVRIHPGNAVRIEAWGGEQPLVGRVRLVEPGAFTKVSALGVDEQRTNVVIDVVTPPIERPTLADAYRVDARIVVATLDEAIVVPTGALFRDREGWAVFVVVDGIARRRSVTLARRSQSSAAVQEGLLVGDLVVLFPGDTLADGTRVTAR